MVGLAHSLDLLDLGGDGVDIDMGRDGLEQNVHRFLDERPGAVNDDERYQNAQDGVNEIPAGIQNDDAADHDADRGQGIAQDVEIGSPDIQAGTAVLVQNKSADDIGNQSDQRHDEHQLAAHRFRMNNPEIGLVQNV